MSPENALTVLDQKYPVQNYNRLFQSENVMNASLAPYQRRSYEVVQIDNNPSSGGIYQTGSKKVGNDWVKLYSLAKQSLDQIGMALSIQWNPEQTRRIDNYLNPRLVVFQAVGTVVKPDGTILILTGTKEVDLDAIEDAQRFKLEETARKGNLWPEGCSAKYPKGQTPYQEGTLQCEREIDRRLRAKMVIVRQHKTRLAESGAKNAAIRSTGLQSSYTLEELKKPFVVSRIDFDASQITDPGLKRRIAERAMGAQNDIYPPSGDSAPFHVEESHAALDPNQEIKQDSDEPLPTTDDPTEEEVARNDYRITLESMSGEDRFVQMESLAKRKKVVGADGTSQWLPGKNWTSKPEQEQIKEIMAVYDRDEPLPTN